MQISYSANSIEKKITNAIPKACQYQSHQREQFNNMQFPCSPTNTKVPIYCQCPFTSISTVKNKNKSKSCRYESNNISKGLFINSSSKSCKDIDLKILKKLKIKNNKLDLNIKKYINQVAKINKKGNKRQNIGVASPFYYYGKKLRNPFTAEEDQKIINLAGKYGTRQWSLIASFLVGRTPKQCRDRYSNYLAPGFFKGEWSKEEDELLSKLYAEIGPKWSVLQKSFPGRSSNSIKNRWNYFLCRQDKIENNDCEKKTMLCQKEYETKEDTNSSSSNTADSTKSDKKEAFAIFDQESEIFDIVDNDMIGYSNEWDAFN